MKAAYTHICTVTNNVGGRRVAVPCARARRVCRTPGRRSTLHAVRTRALSDKLHKQELAWARQCLRRPPPIQLLARTRAHHGLERYERVSRQPLGAWSVEASYPSGRPARLERKKSKRLVSRSPQSSRPRALARAASRTYVTTVNVTCLDLSNHWQCAAPTRAGTPPTTNEKKKDRACFSGASDRTRPPTTRAAPARIEVHHEHARRRETP